MKTYSLYSTSTENQERDHGALVALEGYLFKVDYANGHGRYYYEPHPILSNEDFSEASIISKGADPGALPASCLVDVEDRQRQRSDRLEQQDREAAEADARSDETARQNDLWDAGAEGRYQYEVRRDAERNVR